MLPEMRKPEKPSASGLAAYEDASSVVRLCLHELALDQLPQFLEVFSAG